MFHKHQKPKPHGVAESHKVIRIRSFSGNHECYYKMFVPNSGVVQGLHRYTAYARLFFSLH